AGDPQLVALDLRLDPFWTLVADLLADRLRLVLADPLHDLAVDLVDLAGGSRLARLQRLQRDASLDQLVLEDVEGRLHPVFGFGLQGHRLLAGPLDLRAGAPEVEPGAELPGSLPQRVVDLLAIDLADDVEGRVHCHDPVTPQWVRSDAQQTIPDRKSTRVNSSHVNISYAVFCLK